MLIKKHFHTTHPLHKVLNHRCLKISYCCLNNVKSEITSHNRRLRNSTKIETKPPCDCRKKDSCPLNGKCQITNLVYKADITTEDGDHKIYIGTTGNSFKERHRGHKTSFVHERKANTTELSKYYWRLRNEGKDPVLKWSVIREVRGGYNRKNGCTLCNTERYEIARADKKRLLNKRTERKRVCPHYTSKFF